MNAYDPKCYELAQYFLDSVLDGPVSADTVDDLAFQIQCAIDDFIESGCNKVSE